jgi:hypothetical protein
VVAVVAQWIEHRSSEPVAAGSNPADRANNQGRADLEQKILYFEQPGKHNQKKLIEYAKKRSDELGIRNIVVATTHGGTALAVKEAFDAPGLNIIAVSIAEGYSMREGWCLASDERKKLEENGVRVLTAGHALGDGVASAFAEKYGGKPVEEIVRDAFYRFCQGMKVCVEVVLMAADSGLIPMDKEIMAIAGTSSGADTCIIVKPAYPRTFFDLEIREILAKPRNLS